MNRWLYVFCGLLFSWFVSAQAEQDALQIEPTQFIRKIRIESNDPFGYSENDTLAKPKSKWERLGNRLHFKTRDFAVKNWVLLKEKDPLDSLKIKESERLIRTTSFIGRVKIFVLPTAHRDSVDLVVRTVDAWTIYFDGDVSSLRVYSKVMDYNFLGMGHYFSAQINRQFASNAVPEAQNGVAFQYTIPNIARSYINFTAIYSKGAFAQEQKLLSINRNFYSPLVYWAGGIQYNEAAFLDFFPKTPQEKEFILVPVHYRYYNFWAGYAHKLKRTEKKVINLTQALRYYQMDYIQTPGAVLDSVGYYANDRTALYAISLSDFYFKKDKYIFFDHLVEDIAVGKCMELTLGGRHKNEQLWAYVGANISMGQYYPFGYVGGAASWGSFIHSKGLEETVFRLRATYFSPVIHVFSRKIRQFISPDWVVGTNRQNSFKDRISLLSEYRIPAFRSVFLSGNQRVGLTLQTQSYANKSVYGFRLNPFLNISFGMIQPRGISLKNSEMYSRIGLGLQVNNEYLGFSRFYISLAYFPQVPTGDVHQFMFNTLGSNRMHLEQFNVGQPQLVPFQ